jgi:hypothetical protein
MKSKKTSKKTRKNTRKNKTSKKKWTTAIQAAQTTLVKTGSIKKAQESLNKQALYNARKLFGSIDTRKHG